MTWRQTRLKYLCSDAGQYGLNVPAENYTESGTRLIRTSDIDEGGQLRPAEHGVFVDTTLQDRYVLRPGDLLLSRSGTVGRSLLVQGEVGRATFAGYLVRFRPHDSVDPRFLFYASLSAPFRDSIQVDATSTTIQNFNAERYANISLKITDLDEQRRIVDFLDTECGNVRQLGGLLERQMRLSEARTSEALAVLLDRAQSAVPTRLKFLLRCRPRYGVLVPQFLDDGIPFIRVNDLLDLAGRVGELARIAPGQSAQYQRTIVKRGDLLLAVVGTLGRATIVPDSLVGANIARAVASLRLRPHVSSQLLLAWMRTASFQRQAQLATGTDTAQPTLGMEDVGNFGLRWPADGAEQSRLTTQAVEIQQRDRRLRSLLRQQIMLLEERRQALITAAVTGRIDVTAAGRAAEWAATGR